MGFATAGTEAIRVSQIYSVVSVILCGLSCRCGLFSLSVGVRLALGGMATLVWPWDDERPPASPGHAHASVGMPPGAVGRAERGYAIPTPRTGGPIIVIPSDAVRSRAKHRGSRNPFFSVAQRHR